MSTVLRLVPVAAAIAAIVALSPAASAISPEAGYVQLQLAKLLFSDGRYIEAFNAFEEVKGHDDPRIKREALTGTVKSALRLGDFSHAYADGQLLARSSPRNAESLANLRRRAVGRGPVRGCRAEVPGVACDRARQRAGAARARREASPRATS